MFDPGAGRDLTVVEKAISMGDVVAVVASGDVVEVFACGTAAAVASQGRLASPSDGAAIGDGSDGKVTMDIRRQLTDVECGRAEDVYGWM